MNKKAISLGVTLGIIGIVMFLIMAVLELGMIAISVIGFVGLIISIVFPVIFVKREREANGGFISFGDAFKFCFVALLIGGLIGTGFQILYANAIEPGYAERMTEQALEMSNSFMEGNIDDEMREQILREAEADTMDKFTIGGMLMSLGYMSIFYAVLSLIIAAIMKKQPIVSSDTLDG